VYENHVGLAEVINDQRIEHAYFIKIEKEYDKIKS
jgi:hypothetical protein